MNGAKALMRALTLEKVEYIFGIPGGANLPAYDAVYRDKIKHIHARHEQGAGHMAAGYAKASGKPGVVFATSGPGATNLVTPIADAYMDSVPVVFITGQVKSSLLGTDAFQEADIFGITMPIVKHSFMIQSADEIIPTIRAAFHIASTGRPGPVLIDIPQDYLREERVSDNEAPLSLPGYQPKKEGNDRQIRRVAEALSQAKRPVFYGGGGIINSNSSETFTELAGLVGAPVTCTLMGLGSYPSTDPLWLGMLGMHGSRAANWAVDQADLLVSVGARFDDRVTGDVAQFSPNSKKVHLDIDPAEISKIVGSDIPCVGDLADVLHKLVQEYKVIETDSGRLDPWIKTIQKWKTEHPFSYHDSEDIIKPQKVIEEIYKQTNGEAIVTSDVGQHQMWTAQYYPFSYPRRWINSGGLGTMGVGLPYAIGAKIARPDLDVVCVAGDGSLQMTLQELAAAKVYNVEIKVVVLDNGGYGMVRQWQELFWDEHYMAISMEGLPDWKMLAQAFSCGGEEVSDPKDLSQKIEWLMKEEGPALLHVHVDPQENCWPMIPSGAAARDMIG